MMYGQGPMMSALQQSQYNAKLAECAQQQQLLAEWSKRMQQQQQMGMAMGNSQPGALRGPSGGTQFLQMGVNGLAQAQAQAQAQSQAQSNAGQRQDDSKALASLKAHENRVAEREAAVRREEAQLQAEERADTLKERQLNTRAAALTAKEKQVADLQNELMQEQRKIWRVMQRRRQGGALITAGSGVDGAPVAATPQQQRQLP